MVLAVGASWAASWAFGKAEAFLPAAGRVASRVAMHAKVTPVVDDSDLDEAPAKPKGAPASSKAQTASFEAMVEAAGDFSTKMDRSKRKSRSGLLSLEAELEGLSLEDEKDLDAQMMATARPAKRADVSLQTRLMKWWEETKMLMTNPTKGQLVYGSIFAFFVVCLIVTFIIVFSMGAISFKGDGEMFRRMEDNFWKDGYVERYRQISENRMKWRDLEDITDILMNENKMVEAPYTKPEWDEPNMLLPRAGGIQGGDYILRG